MLKLLTIPGRERELKLCRKRNVDGICALQAEIGRDLRRQVREVFVQGYQKQVRECAQMKDSLMPLVWITGAPHNWAGNLTQDKQWGNDECT